VSSSVSSTSTNSPSDAHNESHNDSHNDSHDTVDSHNTTDRHDVTTVDSHNVQVQQGLGSDQVDSLLKTINSMAQTMMAAFTKMVGQSFLGAGANRLHGLFQGEGTLGLPGLG
jgi:hypothetical protein